MIFWFDLNLHLHSNDNHAAVLFETHTLLDRSLQVLHLSTNLSKLTRNSYQCKPLLYVLRCKLLRVCSRVCISVLLEALTMLVNNLIKIFVRHAKHYFISFVNTKYWWILRIPFILFELWSTEKSYMAPLKKISPCSIFVKSFDMIPKQKLCQLMLHSL